MSGKADTQIRQSVSATHLDESVPSTGGCVLRKAGCRDSAAVNFDVAANDDCGAADTYPSA